MLVEPESADAAAAVVAAAAQDRQPVFIRGGGSKNSPTLPAAPGAIELSTLRLNRLVAHRAGDLTTTVEAGARLADVNRQLAAHNQWLALDPPFAERATIGGIIATNDSGPRRHRYGSPRDQIIGIEIARADGVRAKSGGIVVKNVAGYDLARLITGSRGSLGVILSATFKLYPLPTASRTVVCDLRSHAQAGAVVAAINGSQLTPTAVEVQQPPLRLLIRFESTEASVESQSAAASRLAAASGASAAIVTGDAEAAEWRGHQMRPWNGAGSVSKVTLLPSDLPAVLAAVERSADGAEVDIVGRAGLGVLLVRIDGDASIQQRAIAALRSRVPLERGSVVVVRGAEALGPEIDAWGPAGDAFRVMQAVKRSLDPERILNPGMGPGGL
jgi:glycolate oxidase FAD binding subunit